MFTRTYKKTTKDGAEENIWESLF